MAQTAGYDTVSQRPEPVTQAPAQQPAAGRRRNDIQGIRAICMIGVMIFHAWGVASPIGVDAFILVSAYLMTKSFVGRSEHGKMPFFVERWATTFKRLLPPLVITVLVTLWAATRFLPERNAREMVRQAYASIGQWENWHLMSTATDYHADTSGQSPFLHLWSMSVQGQVFILWPVLMTLAVLCARALKANVRIVVAVAFAILTVVSIWWLLTAGQQNPNAAYFNTMSRVWEFSLGSIVAAVEPWLRRGRVAAIAPFATWGGLAILVAYYIHPLGPLPGITAAIPMLAVSAMLVWGDQQSGTPSRLLSVRPLVWLGDISYCAYLVHWPIFVVFLQVVGHAKLSIFDGLVLIAVSLVIAHGLTVLVDDPIRLWSWGNRNTLTKVAVAVVVFALGNAGVYVLGQRVEQRVTASIKAAEELDPELYPGAQALLTGDMGRTYPVAPIPTNEEGQHPALPDPCDPEILGYFDPSLHDGLCQQKHSSDPDADTLLIVGDSHEKQMISQGEVLAAKRNLNVLSLFVGDCRLGDDKPEYRDCVLFNEGAQRYIAEQKPEYLLIQSTQGTPDTPDEHVVPDLPDLVRTYTDMGIQIIGVRDNIQSKKNMFDCSMRAVQNGSPMGCVYPASQYLAPENPARVLEGIPGFHSIDMTDMYCRDGMCPGVIGNVFVYLDDNHVTMSYSRTLEPEFVRRASAALGW